MTALSNHRRTKKVFTNPAFNWEPILVQLTLRIFLRYFIILLLVTRLQTHKLSLSFLLFFLKFLIKLPSTFVVASIVNEDTRVSKSAPSSLKEVFTELRIIVYPCRTPNKSRSFQRSQCACKLFMFQVRICQVKLIHVTSLTSIDPSL